MPSKTNRILTNPEEIRQWAEERQAKPACVMGTGDQSEPGMIRLDFPGYSGAGKLQEIAWEEWFQQFEENNLALIVQDKTAKGEPSNFNKIVSRDRAEDGNAGRTNRGTSRGTGSAHSGKSAKSNSADEHGKSQSSSSGNRGAKGSASGSKKSSSGSSSSRTGASQSGRSRSKSE